MISTDPFDFDGACSYIEEAGRLGSRPGLARIRALCDELGNPESQLRFIHIAGTNGKGSTACMISSVLAEAGLSVGLYTSPALCGINDHYRINSRLISDEDYAMCVSSVASANERLIARTGEGATQFELETAVAFEYFCKNHCDAVVIECGMGGADDATNIVTGKVCCVLTSISFDHMQYLGNSLGEIASAKAGIITSDCPVIAFDSSPETTDVIRKKCEESGSRLYLVKQSDINSRICSGEDHDTELDDICFSQSVDYAEFPDVMIPFAGTYQADNAALAIQTLCVIRDNGLFECSIDDDVVRNGLAKARWPFRFECIHKVPPVFVDGAHNFDAAKRLRESFDRYLEGYKIILVAGMFADKKYDKVMEVLAGVATIVFTVETPDNPRALSAKELAKCAGKYCNDVYACDSIEEAYRRSVEAASTFAKRGIKAAVTACGSLSYLARFRAAANTE